MMYLLRTTSQKRQALWERIFAMSQLPIKQGRPRLVRDQSGNYQGYDLDLSQLHPMAVSRLAGYIAKENRQPYAMALQCLKDQGFIIRDDDTIEVIEMTAEEERPSFDLNEKEPYGSFFCLFGFDLSSLF